jgi:hypothetical protein
VEDALALFDGAEDGAEIIVRENHVCGFFGDVCAEFAHADTDVCFLESGSVVYAVAGHGYDVPAALQCVDDF